MESDLNDSVDSLNNKENEDEQKSPSPSNVLVQNETNVASPVDDKTEPQVGQKPCQKVAANLACEWSTKKSVYSQAMIAKGAIAKALPPPPQAYLAKDIYQRKREEAERRRAEEERKLREFHPRPVPKFDQHHEQLQKRKPVHAITVPVTPQVLKNSREAEEKRRKRVII